MLGLFTGLLFTQEKAYLLPGYSGGSMFHSSFIRQ